MTKYIKKSEIEKMANNVIDELTGMTELDYYEYRHPYDDVIIIDDSDVIDVEFRVIKSKIIKRGKR